jgi:hypothetical protein
MGRDWHDAGEENRNAAVDSLRGQLEEARAQTEGLVIREGKEIPPGVERTAPLFEPEPDYLREVNGSEFWTAEIPEIKWSVPGILRAGLSVLIGAMKVGKSTLLTDLALSIATGGKFLDNFPTQPGDVLFLSYEDNLSDLKNRARALGYAEARGAFPRLQINFDAPRQNDGGLDLIQTWAESHPDRRLVIIDPLAKFRRHCLPNEKGLNSYELDYAVIGEIHNLAVRYGFSVLVCQHEKKGAETDWLLKSSGSVALTAAANGVLRLDRKRGENDARLSITGRGIKEREYALRGNGLRWEFCGDAEQYAASQLTTSILELLRQSGEMSTKEIAETLGRKQDVIRNTIRRASTWKELRPALFYKSDDGKRWGARDKTIGLQREKSSEAEERENYFED